MVAKLRADQILSKQSTDINWLAPTENIYKISDKIIHPLHARVCCYQQLNTNETEELTKVKFRAFDSSVGLHQNDFIEKNIRQEEEKCCEVSQDTAELFFIPSKCSESCQHPAALLWYIPFQFDPYLYIFPVGITSSP